MSRQADFVSDQFAEILDMSRSELMALLKPSYHPDRCTIESYKAEVKQWDDLQASNARMRQSARISSAGNALADVGAVLFKVGRDSEASKFCEWGSKHTDGQDSSRTLQAY